MTTAIQLQLIQLIVIIVGGVVVWMNTRNRKTDATTAVTASDAKQAEAVTALALMNNQERIAAQLERQNLQEQLSKLRESFSYEQGVATASLTKLQERLDRLQIKADASEAQVHLLEGKVNELTQSGTAGQATIAELKTEIISLKTEIVSLNKTIVARDDTIKGLEKRLNELYERVIGKQEGSIIGGSTGAAIPITLATSGTITQQPPNEKDSGANAA